MEDKEELRKNLRSTLKDLDMRDGIKNSLLDQNVTEIEKRRKDLIDEVDD